MSANTKFLLVMFFIFCALGYAGVHDFEQETEMTVIAYCERVELGLHSNFRNLDCGNSVAGVSQ